eukprot:536121-Pleurochrysis_carterae.AAC.3
MSADTELSEQLHSQRDEHATPNPRGLLSAHAVTQSGTQMCLRERSHARLCRRIRVRTYARIHTLLHHQRTHAR